MRSGYYLVTKDRLLSGQRPNHRVRLRRGDWLVTDGIVVGRFDQTQELDWVPLDWIRGVPVILDEAVEPELSSITAKIPVSRLQASFNKLMFVEPGEVSPDMPLPTLAQLGSYLKARRTLVAYTYDCRP
jgi:hypothetical protein